MASNVGKVFEESIKSSIPDYCMYYRLKDSANSFGGGSNLRFSIKNPCDMFMFDTKNRVFHAIELKSTKAKSMSFEDIYEKGKQPTKMIHKHQIKGLMDFSNYDHVKAGFMFNFRDEINNTETTYYQDINDFIKMVNEIGKKSFNINDLKQYNSIQLKGEKKRVKYTWFLHPILINE